MEVENNLFVFCLGGKWSYKGPFHDYFREYVITSSKAKQPM